MGKGFENYMSKKWFHPTNVENQKRKFLAEQQAAAEKKRQQELRDQYEREQEIFNNKQLMGDDKARLGLSFMYNAPGSLKDQEQKNDANPNEEKFEWQKNSPLEQVTKTNQTDAKNVRCLKCKRWGHVNTDKKCPLYGKSRLDADSDSILHFETELSIQNIKTESLEEKKDLIQAESQRVLIESSNSADDNDTDITLDMLRALPKKEKKMLLKRLLRLEKKKRKHLL